MTRVLSIAFGMLVLAFPVQEMQAQFYKGKTITMIVNYPAGGPTDLEGRIVAQHLPSHIPGNPTIVVKNLPGAGSAKAGHHITTIAPKDGLSIGAVTPGAIIGPLLDEKPETIFDPLRVIYLGTANAGARICVTFEKSKTRTFEQALTQKTVMGGVAAGGRPSRRAVDGARRRVRA